MGTYQPNITMQYVPYTDNVVTAANIPRGNPLPRQAPADVVKLLRTILVSLLDSQIPGK
jgi:hypothetical protein